MGLSIEVAEALAFAVRLIGPLALATIGFALIYRVSGELHFAYGGIWVVASYVIGWALSRGYTIVLAALLAVTAAVSLAVVCHLVYRRLSGQFTVVLTSFGIFTVLIAVTHLIWGPETLGYSPDNPLSSVWQVTVADRVVAVPQAAIAGLVASIIIAVLGALLLGSTSVGLQLQALSQNPELADSTGINRLRTNVICYVVGTAISVLSALFHVLGYGASLDSGTTMILGGLTATILAGPVIVLSVCAAALFGVLQVFANILAGPQSIYLIGYTVLLLVLRVKPNGLFAKDLTIDLRSRARPSASLTRGQHE